MTNGVTNVVFEIMPHFEGYVYPNEATAQPLWSVLIVLYPYITGLVAGAFIMASLVRVFKVQALEPVYRLSMLTAFAFLLCAPLPLLFHLGHPERCFEVMMTPHLTSPMAIFGFVYAWYLMAVLLLELWFDYRRDLVIWSEKESGFKGILYRLFTVGVTDISEPAVRLDSRIGHILSIVGIPSAFLLHGYVGFIFGSIKANPWWGNVLMPIIFIMSAMVSGIALCVFNYLVLSWIRRKTVDMRCIDVMGKFLFYALVMDAAIEGLDWIHRGHGVHGPGEAVLHVEHGSGPDGDPDPAPAAWVPATRPQTCAGIDSAAVLLCEFGADPHRCSCHALERRHRRPVVLQESARGHELQAGICRHGGVVHGRLHDGLAIHPSDRDDQVVHVREAAQRGTL